LPTRGDAGGKFDLGQLRGLVRQDPYPQALATCRSGLAAVRADLERILGSTERGIGNADLLGGLVDLLKRPGAIHVRGKDDGLAEVAPLLELVNNWRSLLQTDISDEEAQLLRRHERTGRPLCSKPFLHRLERRMDRVLQRQKPGPKLESKGQPVR
jgi:hypothetical protein